MLYRQCPRWLGRVGLSLFFFVFFPICANAGQLEKPIDCQIGLDCFIQNYVDLAPGPEYADENCGSLSYDKHKGTDFRVAFDKMQAGVEVKAAAPGVVRGMRDGMEDISIRQGGEEAIKNRECGNGLVVLLADGTETQYCHMRKGSLRVKAGDQVATGQVLGLVGLSGDTEFPHLHFEVRKNGQTLCPFTGNAMESGCATAEKKPLWSAKALEEMPYISTGALDAGFSATPPDINKLFVAQRDKETFSAHSPELVFWAGFWGLHKDDVITLQITPPNGPALSLPPQVIPKNQAQALVTINIKRKEGTLWPAGSYKGEAVLVRRNPNEKSLVLPLTRTLTMPATAEN